MTARQTKRPRACAARPGCHCASIALIARTIDAKFIPLLVATNGIKLTNHVTARFVVTTGSTVSGEATSRTVYAGGKQATNRRNFTCADVVPVEKAAKRILLADVLAAGRILAAGRPVGEEAGSATRAARVKPVHETVSQLGACIIPRCITAVRVEPAD